MTDVTNIPTFAEEKIDEMIEEPSKKDVTRFVIRSYPEFTGPDILQHDLPRSTVYKEISILENLELIEKVREKQPAKYRWIDANVGDIENE